MRSPAGWRRSPALTATRRVSLAMIAATDRKHQAWVAVAAAMREPQPARKLPVIRLVEDDFDGAYDDMPSKYAAAA